jgi:hypothetical protein
MNAINEIFFPIFLVIFYFSVATWFLDNNESAELTIDSTEQEHPVAPSIVTIDNPVKLVTIDPTFNIEWLRSQSLLNLKSIARELCITPTDRRSKDSWIDAIATTFNSHPLLEKA